MQLHEECLGGSGKPDRVISSALVRLRSPRCRYLSAQRCRTDRCFRGGSGVESTIYDIRI